MSGSFWKNVFIGHKNLWSKSVPTTPAIEYALDFDGNGDYVNCGAVRPAADFSIRVEVMFDALDNFHRIVGNRNNEGSRVGFELITVQTSNLLRFQVDNGPTYNFIDSTSAVTTGVWYNLTIIRNGTDIELYIGDTSEGTPSGAVTGDLGTDADDFYMATSKDVIATSAFFLEGKIRDVKVFDGKALSGAEVATLNAGGSVSGLTNHWDFSDGMGSTLSDVVGSNDGTITNATWVEL